MCHSTRFGSCSRNEWFVGVLHFGSRLLCNRNCLCFAVAAQIILDVFYRHMPDLARNLLLLVSFASVVVDQFDFPLFANHKLLIKTGSSDQWTHNTGNLHCRNLPCCLSNLRVVITDHSRLQANESGNEVLVVA